MNSSKILFCLLAVAVAGLGATREEARECAWLRVSLPNMAGRTVFRNIETVRFVAEFGGRLEEGAEVRAAICQDAGPIVRTLEAQSAANGSVTWQVELRGLAPGAYRMAARLTDGSANRTCAQDDLPFHVLQRPHDLDFLPVCTRFTPVPSGRGWRGESGPLSAQILRDTIDNLLDHGITALEAVGHGFGGSNLSQEQAALVMNYAQARGMVITYHTGALEIFGRNAPPNPCVYSPEYAETVRRLAEGRLAPLKDIPRLYNVFTYQDEPFHGGPNSFGYNDEVKAEFKKRYGYELPPDLDSIRDDPKKWLDVITFRSDYFPDGWRQVYPIIKNIDPSFKTTLTHDSHNTFGGGCTSHSVIAIDDVFHWGGDFSDIYIYDLYPYLSLDFRFGEPSKLPEPRISQTHYSFAQMRNLTRAYKKDLGFWFGAYPLQMPPDDPGPRGRYWGEREMSTTAVAHGADYLILFYNVPTDPKHWESLGEGLRLIQKAGGRLLDAPKVKAKAAMLFPRTHYVQLQEEYFNVGLSFELFLRAFGELDILHEKQILDQKLDGYEVLLLFDVKLLPRKVAKRIAAFARRGGVVIADCLPQIDEYKRPLETMADLFGVKDAETSRIRRYGHWVFFAEPEPIWHNRPADAPDESVYKTDRIEGAAFGQPLDLTVVSPRPCVVTTGETILETAAGIPGVVQRRIRKGHAFLLGFCLQDTYFKTWQDDDEAARAQLRGLLEAMVRTAGVRPHVHSTNPDIEAAIRANKREAFLFIINHETERPNTCVTVADLGFEIGVITDMADGRPIPFTREHDAVQLDVSAPLGETRLLRLSKWP